MAGIGLDFEANLKDAYTGPWLVVGVVVAGEGGLKDGGMLGGGV